MAGVGFGTAGYFFGGSLSDNGSTFVTAFGADVYDVVGSFDYIQVVFNNDYGVSAFGETFSIE